MLDALLVSSPPNPENHRAIARKFFGAFLPKKIEGVVLAGEAKGDDIGNPKQIISENRSIAKQGVDDTINFKAAGFAC